MVDRPKERVKIGCCDFPCSRSRYFEDFRLVEIQQSFYKVPQIETAVRWRREAPSDFEFSIKAWQLITHRPNSPTYCRSGIQIAPGTEEKYGFFTPSSEVFQAWEMTERFARALDARVVVFQCPPSFREEPRNIENIRTFFTTVRNPSLLFVWEPRGEWREETIKSLCSDLGLIHCVDPLVARPLYGRPRYFRLHGCPRYQHRYSLEELERLKSIVLGEACYVLFNNISMYSDALAFKHLMDKEPPLRYTSQ